MQHHAHRQSPAVAVALGYGGVEVDLAAAGRRPAPVQPLVAGRRVGHDGVGPAGQPVAIARDEGGDLLQRRGGEDGAMFPGGTQA